MTPRPHPNPQAVIRHPLANAFNTTPPINASFKQPKAPNNAIFTERLRGRGLSRTTYVIAAIAWLLINIAAALFIKLYVPPATGNAFPWDLYIFFPPFTAIMMAFIIIPFAAFGSLSARPIIIEDRNNTRICRTANNQHWCRLTDLDPIVLAAPVLSEVPPKQLVSRLPKPIEPFGHASLLRLTAQSQHRWILLEWFPDPIAAEESAEDWREILDARPPQTHELPPDPTTILWLP